MDTVVEARVKAFLEGWLHYQPLQADTIIEKMRFLANAAGFDLDARFARAGLGAGPECRIASGIVDRALLGGGAETSDYAIRKEVDQWLRRTPLKRR